MAKGPVLIDLSQTPSVADAPPVPDTIEAPMPQGRAMQTAARMAARRPSLLARLFWWVLTTLTGTVVSVAAWDFANDLIARAPVLGWIVTGLFTLFVVILLMMAIRELAALARLTRIDDLRHQAATAIEAADLVAARKVTDRLVALYSRREDTRWGRDRLNELRGDQMDAAALLTLADAELLAPLDTAASREVEAAARQVAAVTALVPLALADVAAALTANLRMIRRVADVYGGRSGFFGSWRLTRAVLSHLVATGAVAVGDDMLEPVLGGSLLGKLSRRFGEGLVNGALTARVGVAAMEVCRPLPFPAGKRPTSRGIVQRSLTGLFGSKDR
ncbi:MULTISPECIES: YcjF family protein [Roseobacteraceae]|jgi:putative membrane protein|uniref:TIGR01620 family protein n=1 Tax=Pseudosulfitobacter pseudonitzschiae TaxID=1402135 RepID=A0A221K281_9RHOB|nr:MULTISPECIES: TIGR01620 family protein [Roseobacteraceae]ASM73023.1 TIGR01620 family protein [Pseudosulfitobacter pseudonitzschiae]